jgi:hypothetical protein
MRETKPSTFISLFGAEERTQPSPPRTEGIYGHFSGLHLVEISGDEAVISCGGRAPRIGEALLLRDGGEELVLQVIGSRVSERGKFIRAKVRSSWNGFLPGPGAELSLTQAPFPTPEGREIHLGKTVDGIPFPCGGRALEKVNLIVGAKGSGKSHLAKILLLGLVQAGAPCLVLDLNREYGGLPGVEVLKVGQDFRLGVRELGVAALSTMLEAFGTPATSLLHFEVKLGKLLQEQRELERKGKPTFLGVDELVKLAEEGDFYPTYSKGADAVNRTLRSRLEALAETGMVARSPLEACSFQAFWERIRGGGALAFDLSSLSTPARQGFSQALLRFLFELVEGEEKELPFVFFEEAHSYVSPQGIDALVTRARHSGITSFFITNTPTALPEGVLRAADNLFLFRLPLEEDLKWVGKSALTDFSTLSSLNRALPKYGCLAIGEATDSYPAILLPDPLSDHDTKGKTRYFF